MSTSTNTLGTLSESLKFNFLIKYASAEKPESPQDLHFEFTLNNYKVILKIFFFSNTNFEIVIIGLD